MILKNHHDPRYLQKKIDEGFTSKDIANELRVSYKLVELYLVKYNIKHESQKPKQ
jgi:orotate phosphoribosyltransferase-like protein